MKKSSETTLHTKKLWDHPFETFSFKSVVQWDAIKADYWECCWRLSLVGAEGRIHLKQQSHIVFQDIPRNADLTEELQVLQVHEERLKNKQVFDFEMTGGWVQDERATNNSKQSSSGWHTLIEPSWRRSSSVMKLKKTEK